VSTVDEAALAYLERVLALDPAEDAPAIGALARAWRASGTAQEAAPGSPRIDDGIASASETREELVRSISAIREGFWDMRPDDARRMLDLVDASGHPDLERAVVRMRGAAALREEIDALEEDRSVTARNVERIRLMLVAPSKEGAALRDEMVRTLGRPAQQRERKALLRAIDKHAPGLARQERRWVERLKGARRERKDSRAVAGGIGCIGAYFIGSALVRLVRFLFEWISES
jgi:hypothetical protein